MPIKGLETRARVRYPTVGRFALAFLKPGGGTEQIDYFIVPKELRLLLEQDRPTEVRIRFPGMSLAALFEHDMLLWGGKPGAGTVRIRCDGERARVFPKNGASVVERCAWDDKEKPCPHGCKAEGRLVFVVVHESAPQGLGPYEVRINGLNRVAQTLGLLGFYLGHLGERFPTAEFLLKRVPKQGAFLDKDGNRRTRPIHPVYIVFDRMAGLSLPPVTTAALQAAPEADAAHDGDEPAEDEAAEAEDAEVTPIATEPELLAMAAKARVAPGLLQQYLKAKYPGLTDDARPAVYGALLEQMRQAVEGGEPALADLKAGFFRAMKDAAMAAGGAR